MPHRYGQHGRTQALPPRTQPFVEHDHGNADGDSDDDRHVQGNEPPNSRPRHCAAIKHRLWGNERSADGRRRRRRTDAVGALPAD